MSGRVRYVRGSEASMKATKKMKFSQTPYAEGYPSGQRGQTVNLLAYAFEGSNPSPSTI